MWPMSCQGTKSSQDKSLNTKTSSGFKFSKTSLKRLEECHEDLIRLHTVALNDVRCPFDYGIACGHRSKKEQDKAFNEGKSKLKWPKSKHNKTPSLATDFYPVVNGKAEWDDLEPYKALIIHFKTVANELGITISCGGDWKKFKDYPHIELIL